MVIFELAKLRVFIQLSPYCTIIVTIKFELRNNGKELVARSDRRKNVAENRKRRRERENRGWTNSRGSHDTRERTRRTRRMSMAAPGKISQAAQVESGI